MALGLQDSSCRSYFSRSYFIHSLTSRAGSLPILLNSHHESVNSRMLVYLLHALSNWSRCLTMIIMLLKKNFSCAHMIFLSSPWISNVQTQTLCNSSHQSECLYSCIQTLLNNPYLSCLKSLNKEVCVIFIIVGCCQIFVLFSHHRRAQKAASRRNR